ncbi:MAG: penicillin-binding protein 2 [bacterium]|nr:penicillin-binding protein 2 [bacterium]
MKRPNAHNNISFEDSLSEDWSRDLDTVEVRLDDRPIIMTGIAIFAVVLVIAARVLYLNIAKGSEYARRAEGNMSRVTLSVAPRGIIYDREGKVLAENRAVFDVVLDTHLFLSNPEFQSITIDALHAGVGLPSADVWKLLSEQTPGGETLNPAVVVVHDASQEELVYFRSVNLPTLEITSSFERTYPEGQALSHVLGYTGYATRDDIESGATKGLGGKAIVGKGGVEEYYESQLQGTPGREMYAEDAKGNLMIEEKKEEPRIGGALHLTIDTGFQKYFYERMRSGLASLGKTRGVALALDPQNGEVLALISFPTFDANILSGKGHNTEKRAILNSSDKPLFNRVVAGAYAPASTIKPLVGVAALAEHVIDPARTIFSPGYLDVPNPYDPDKPTRFLDWRYQGDVNLASAIAQSSDVYFYEVGGGFERQKGLGISRLHDWWERFRFGVKTGIDLPHEVDGFLPTPEWKEKTGRGAWLLGNTYHVSIGQGDLQVTPIQLLSYISAIGNGGKVYKPRLNQAGAVEVSGDLASFASEFREVQKGMVATVRSPMGTAHLLSDMPVSVGAKTGSAQVLNNTQENAFFTGYMPAQNPKIAILVLVEHSLEGSLNAVPIAKDVLNWYYWNRIKK